MVLVLDGFLDAGNAAAIAARHLVDQSGGGRVVATFEVDEFHDYRARRPAMSFVRDHYEQYDAPRLVVRLLADASGAPYLLLAGPEPDNRWEAFTVAVRQVVERFGVSRVIGMGAVPMAVPHTRPIAITHHANNPNLLSGDSPWRGETVSVQRPGAGEGAAAGGVVARLDGLRGPHPPLPRPARLPPGVGVAPRARRARRGDGGGRPDGPPRERAGPRRGGHDVPREQHRGGRGGGGAPGAGVRRVSARASRSPATAAPRRRIEPPPDGRGDRAASSSSSWPASTPPRATSDAVVLTAELVETLDLETLEDGLYRGRQPETSLQRVFGGQVAGQALAATIRTVEPGRIRALAARLLPAPRRHGGADRLRRREHPRRPLVQHPARRRAPARAADLLHDGLVPGRRSGSSTRTRCPRFRPPEDCPTWATCSGRSRAGGGSLGAEWAALDVRYAGDSRAGGG